MQSPINLNKAENLAQIAKNCILGFWYNDFVIATLASILITSFRNTLLISNHHIYDD